MILRCWRPPRSAGSDRLAVAVDRHPDGAVLEQRLVGDRGRGPDGHLDRRLVAAAALDRPLEVEEDPGVGGLLELELLDLDLAVAGGRLPVDPVEAVARRVRPDGGRERRGLERPLGRRVAALDARRRQPPQRQRLDPRVDDDRDALPDRRRRLEEAERVAGPDLERLDPEVAAPDERRPDEPRPLGPRAEGDRPAGQPAGQRRRVVDLEPRLRQPARVAQRVGDLEPVADVAGQLVDRVAGLEVGQPEAGQDVRAADDEDRQVDEVEEELAARSRTPRSGGSRRSTSSWKRRIIGSA